MSTGDTYMVCEKCTRRFAVGNVPTNVCGDCDENQRLRTALAAAERERDEARKERASMTKHAVSTEIELRKMTAERDAAKAEVERLRELCKEADRHLKDYEGDCVQDNRKATERAVWVVREEIKAALTPAPPQATPTGEEGAGQ